MRPASPARLVSHPLHFRRKGIPRLTPDEQLEPFDSLVSQDYGRFASLADLFRQIGYDERVHKEESLAWLVAPRFA